MNQTRVRQTKRLRKSYLTSIEPITRTNEDGTVDMLLDIVVPASTYHRFRAKWSTQFNKYTIYVQDGIDLLRTNSVRHMVVNVYVTQVN